jgi:hypothetical protein
MPESRKRAILGSASLDFGSIATTATAELTITVLGAAAGDVVAVGPPSDLDAGLLATAYVSAANTVTVRLYNSTGGAIDPADSVWNVAVIK